MRATWTLYSCATWTPYSCATWTLCDTLVHYSPCDHIRNVIIFLVITSGMYYCVLTRALHQLLVRLPYAALGSCDTSVFFNYLFNYLLYTIIETAIRVAKELRYLDTRPTNQRYSYLASHSIQGRSGYYSMIQLFIIYIAQGTI